MWMLMEAGLEEVSSTLQCPDLVRLTNKQRVLYLKPTTILGEAAADSHLVDNNQWCVSRRLPCPLSGDLL